MGVQSHIIEHRLLGSMASLLAALIHLDQKRFRFSIPGQSGPVVRSFIE